MTAGTNQLNTTYISSSPDFNELCQQLETKPVLALDSEFIRTSTFFPKPGLIQLACEGDIFLIDPIAINDWKIFLCLISNSAITTVMHSCSEDLSLLQHMMGAVPARLFDTQRAAAFLGHGYSISYQALVLAELDLDVPKGETRSDWLRRPLSDSQLNYAALDVAYLEQLHDQLKEKLVERNMLAWFQQDCSDLLRLVKDETLESEWAQAYKSIGSAWSLNPVQLDLLQKLCYWREATARKRDRPRNWIVKDNDLLELTMQLASQLQVEQSQGEVTEAMINATQVLPAKFAQREAVGIASIINQNQPFSEPAEVRYLDKPLTPAYRKQLRACQNAAKDIAAELAIAPELLARKRQWVELLYRHIRGEENIWPQSMDNWRKQILESAVTAILQSDT